MLQPLSIANNRENQIPPAPTALANTTPPRQQWVPRITFPVVSNPPTTPPPPAAVPALGIEVPVSRIDPELRRLWEQDEARSNASLINLVVYSESSASLEGNSAIIRQLTRHHACRAILVEMDRSTENPSVRAWITAHCHLSHGHKSVCCEQIALHFTGRAKGRLRNTVFAHLNADLPVVFWWQGALSGVFDERLASAIDRFIFDSSAWPDAGQSFGFLREIHQRSSGRTILQDLAWTRIWHFRQCLARLFDDAVAQDAIPAIRRIHLRHHPEHLHSALLFIAWFAHQAGWDIAGPGRLTGTGGATIAFELHPDATAHVLHSVDIDAGAVRIRVACKEGCSHFHGEIKAPGGHEVETVSPADPLACEALVAEQLSRGGRNSLYHRLLPLFLNLLHNQQPHP
jgi:glucose-6-phosphate dehydrogenase assembly protein OpcA